MAPLIRRWRATFSPPAGRRPSLTPSPSTPRVAPIPAQRLRRFDLQSEVAERIDVVRADRAPDAAAAGRVAPPVPLARAVAAARTRVPHLGVADRTELADALAHRPHGGHEAHLVIDDGDELGMLARLRH